MFQNTLGQTDGETRIKKGQEGVRDGVSVTEGVVRRFCV